MINTEIKEMYNRWIEKAGSYNETELSDSFDKFFTLFVAYNILYIETTKILVSEGKARLNSYGGVPDSEGATKNVVKYLDNTFLSRKLLEDPQITKAIVDLNSVISSKFYIKDTEWDRKRMDAINSNQDNRVAKAILELIYGVRCNMFHGSKEFIQMQKEILNPCIIILEKVNKLLFDKLTN